MRSIIMQAADFDSLWDADEAIGVGALGDAVVDVANAGASVAKPGSKDANTLAGAASGAAMGASVGGVYGAAIGFIAGALGGASGSTLPWLDPGKIGQFAYDCFIVGASRQLLPWDIGPGLIGADGPPPSKNSAGTIGPMATNLVNEQLMKRRDLSGAYALGPGPGHYTIAPDGTMPEEIEAACFMFSQVYCARLEQSDPTAIVAAQTRDFGSLGDSVHNAIRGQMQNLIVYLPAPHKSIFSVAQSTAEMRNVGKPSPSTLLLLAAAALGVARFAALI